MMGNIEKLTPEEREYLDDHDLVGGRKALRIIEQQAVEIVRLAESLAAAEEARDAMGLEAQQQLDRAEAAEARCLELEAACGALEHKLKAELESGWKDKAVAARSELAQLRGRALAPDDAEQLAPSPDYRMSEVQGG